MSAGNLPVVHVIREALECVLAPEVAAAVFFESLNGPDGVPETKEEVALMVRGPLYASLVERVGTDEANVVVERILVTLEPMPSAGLSRKSREEDATRAVPTHRRPVKVRVVAGGPGFATRLRYVLGPTRIEVEHATDPAQIASEAPPAPSIVIVDATDFPPQDPVAIVRALEALPPATTRVLWASELPFGQRCREAFFEGSGEVVALARGEGIEPLLDLIRSRRDSS
jgi:hypothetical protein